MENQTTKSRKDHETTKFSKSEIKRVANRFLEGVITCEDFLSKDDSKIIDEFREFYRPITSMPSIVPDIKNLFIEAEITVLLEAYRHRESYSKLSGHAKRLGIKQIPHGISKTSLVKEYILCWEKKYKTKSKLRTKINDAFYECGEIPSPQVFTTAYDSLKIDRDELKLEELKESIKYDGVTTPEQAIERFRKFIRPALRNPEEDKIIAKMFYHFCWQVLRKLHGLKVLNHMALILLSPEKGTGKSEFIKQFCDPFINGNADRFIYTDFDFRHIEVEKKKRDLLSRYILISDELKNIHRVDQTNLRNWISSESQDVTPLYEGDSEHIENLSTIIGSYNAETYGEAYKDHDGDRRKFPANIKTFVNVEGDRLDLEEIGHLTPAQLDAGFYYPIEGYDVRSFWKMVNPEDNCQMTIQEATAHQAGHKPSNGLPDFVGLLNLVPGDSPYAVSVMYLIYESHALRANRRAKIMNERQFSNGLTEYLERSWAVQYPGRAYKVKARERSGQLRDQMCFYFDPNPHLESARSRLI